MDIKEIRDELLKQNTLYEQSVMRSKAAVEEIRNTLDSLTDDMIETCREIGVDVTPLKQADLTRAITDSEYLSTLKKTQETIIEQLHSYLEKELCLE